MGDPYPSAPGGLTELQERVRVAFWEAVRDGQACGATSLAAVLGCSHASVCSALQALVTRGYAPRRGSRSFLTPSAWPSMVPHEFLRPDAPGAPTTAQDGRRAEVVQRLAREEIAAQRPVSVPILPSRDPSLDDLRARRREDTHRRAEADTARLLVPVAVHLPGPIGIVHMGDPHLDDDGCDFCRLERHVEVIQQTEGLFGANVGDLQNNWVGRLAALYGEQGPTAREAWLLTAWLVRAVPWLYLVRGNHDCWSGAGDPLDWLVPSSHAEQGVMQAWGTRIELTFPNGRQVRVNARHDFVGHSMWNNAHGPMRAAQQGWRDHILVCGHRHTSGYGVVKCPATGLISHALRVAGYKVHDDYGGGKLGLPNQNVSPAFVTIIDPQFNDDDPRLITTLFDVEGAAEYLTWLRARHAKR